MIREFDKVKITASGKIGVVVDIRGTDVLRYLIELDENNQIIDCKENEIEKLKCKSHLKTTAPRCWERLTLLLEEHSKNAAL